MPRAQQLSFALDHEQRMGLWFILAVKEGHPVLVDGLARFSCALEARHSFFEDAEGDFIA